MYAVRITDVLDKVTNFTNIIFPLCHTLREHRLTEVHNIKSDSIYAI